MTEPTVFCKDCKHLVGKRIYLDEARNWKCAHPKNLREITKDSVTGENVYLYRHATCRDARSLGEPRKPSTWEVCGPIGQWYEKYEPPQDLGPRKPQAGPSAEDLLKELEP